ncbi:hypothetical protein DPV73_10810 [Leptospira mayottensis]|nr:hypothetical protein DPV73_10810 [Leptospira mayottensis]
MLSFYLECPGNRFWDKLSKANVILNVTSVFDDLKIREEAKGLNAKERAEVIYDIASCNLS